MDSYVLGQLFSRVVFPMIAVWLVCLVVARGRFGRSVELAFSRRGVLSMGFLFVTLLATAAIPDARAASTRAASKEHPDRPRREMQVLYNEVSGYEISVDNDPPWRHEVGVSGRAPAMFMVTPPLVIPMLAMAVIDNRVAMEDDAKMQSMASMAFDIMSRKFAATPDALGAAKPAEYGDLEGHEVLFSGRVENEPVDVQLFIGRNPSSVVYTLHAYTKAGKREHLRKSTRRIWGSIAFPESPRGDGKQ